MFLDSSVRIISVKNESVLCNLRNGRWVKISNSVLSYLQNLDDSELRSRTLDILAVSPQEFQEFLNLLAEHEFIIDVYKPAPQWYHPIAAYLNVTDRCNLQCKTCYFSAKQVSETIELNIQRTYAVMDKLVESGVRYLVIAGGEPLIRADITEIIEYAYANFEDVTLITNGTLVTPDNAKKLAESTNLIQISLDGPDEETNSQIRGTGSFSQAMRGIKLLKEADARIIIVCTVTKINIGMLPQMAQLASSLGVEIGSSIFLATGYGACNEKCLTPAWQDLMADFREEIFQLSKQGELSESQYTETSNLRIGLSCGSGTQLISIAPDGTLYPCHVLHKPEFAIGNILNSDNLLALLDNSPVVQQFRNLDVEHKKSCQKCDIRYFCRGGCIAQGLVNTGRLDGRDRFCSLFQKVFRAQIWSISDQMNDRQKADMLIRELS